MAHLQNGFGLPSSNIATILSSSESLDKPLDARSAVDYDFTAISYTCTYDLLHAYVHVGHLIVTCSRISS